MKKLLTFSLFCYLLVLVSCSKSLNKPDDVSSETASADSKATRVTATKTDLLTGKTWVYYEYFSKFNNNPTGLVWKTNRSANDLNLASNKVTFYPNGNYTEIDQNNNTYYGTWLFLNNETQVQTTSSQGTFTSTIQKLTSNRYEWLDTAGHYGVMVPDSMVLDTTGGKFALLTSQPWVYNEYFTNFSLSTPVLMWKPNKAISQLNLTQNWVKFNTDYSYTEIDQYGNTYTGNWAWQNNQTQVVTSSSQGTFVSTIKVLTTERYEWLSSNGVAYGEMEHP